MCDDGYMWGNESYDVMKKWMQDLVKAGNGKDAEE